LDGGLDDPIVDDLHQEVDGLVRDVRQLKSLDLLPIVAFQKLQKYSTLSI
jgi:hypothetical protein